jgi:hypothetical protein
MRTKKVRRGGRPKNIHGKKEPLPFRVHPRQVEFWKKAAGERDLSEWMREVLTDYAQKLLREPYNGPR